MDPKTAPVLKNLCKKKTLLRYILMCLKLSDQKMTQIVFCSKLPLFPYSFGSTGHRTQDANSVM